MKILILGGTGFIGLHLFDRLNKIPGVFPCTYSRHGLSNKRRLHLRDIRHIVGDLSDEAGLFSSLRDVDILIHMISTTVPLDSELNPVLDIETNLLKSVGLFQMIPKTKIKKVIFVSSGGTVYGNPEILPVAETSPINPICSYGIIKSTIEHYLRKFSSEYGFEYAIARISNPYGPGQLFNFKHGVVPNFLNKCMAGEVLNIWGDGKAIRDYIYIDDLIDGLLPLIFNNDASGIYNMGSGKGESILDVISAIHRVTGVEPIISFSKKPTSMVQSIYLDISRASKDLKWFPTTSLEEGIGILYRSLTRT